MDCPILQIPTFHLALSTLSPRRFRHDATFLVLFFMLRIAFHGYLVASFLLPPSCLQVIGASSGLMAIGGSRSAGWLLLSAMPLHVSWFMGGVKGYLKRRSQRATQRSMSRPTENSGMDEHVLIRDTARNKTYVSRQPKDEEVLLSPKPFDLRHPHGNAKLGLVDDKATLSSWSASKPDGMPPLARSSTSPSPAETPIATPMLTPASSLAQISGGYFAKLNISLPLPDIHMPALADLHVVPLNLPSLKFGSGAELDPQMRGVGMPSIQPGIWQDPGKEDSDDRGRFGRSVLARMPTMDSMRKRVSSKRKRGVTL